MTSAREIITLHVGGIGSKLGEEYWKLVSTEHNLAGSRSSQPRREVFGDVSLLYSESKSGEYTPRVISCDHGGSEYAAPSLSSYLAKQLPASNKVLSERPSGNCYARSLHEAGPLIANKALDLVRRELEKCDCLQAMQFFHSTAGGAGSGLTGILLKTLRDYVGSKSIFCSASFVPAPSFSDIVLESYNTVLSLQDLSEYCDMSLLFDSDACSLKKAAQSVSGLSSSVRIPGVLNADLRKIHTNLVPFKNAHFLIFSHVSCGDRALWDVCSDALSREATCLSVDPQILGQTRYLATLLAIRGSNIQPSEADHITTSLQRDKSRFDPFFPDWIPNSICTSISGDKVGSLVAVTNNTCVRQFLDRAISRFSKQFSAKSHVYVYEQAGVHAEEMLEAKNIVEYISDQYSAYASYPDKVDISNSTS